jgi:hypothetical protein
MDCRLIATLRMESTDNRGPKRSSHCLRGVTPNAHRHILPLQGHFEPVPLRWSRIIALVGTIATMQSSPQIVTSDTSLRSIVYWTAARRFGRGDLNAMLY